MIGEAPDGAVSRTGHLEASLADFGIECPRCGRVADSSQEHCPWDGSSLAGGIPSSSAGTSSGDTGAYGEGSDPALEVFEGWRVTVDALERSALPLTTVDYAAVGGGLGSFAWVDALRVRGVEAGQIMVLGLDQSPRDHYGTLARNSQIPDHERIRSNSESTPDNLWGWPGYALREMARQLWHRHPVASLKILWQLLGEPTLAQTYTPKLGDVLWSIDREAARIRWDRMMRQARVHAIRKTDGGRYAILYSRADDPKRKQPKYEALLANHVHLAVGYPGLRILGDVQRYREETGDFRSVVNAYEDHDHVYEHLRGHGGHVVLRGRGIVASRILQRLYEERRHNPDITVTHLIRTRLSNGHRYGRSHRKTKNHFEFQPFNWPRGAWGGSQRKLLERATPQQRKELLDQWGGTTTARRRDWEEIIEKGLHDGWYRTSFDEVERFEHRQGRPVAIVASGDRTREQRDMTVADFVVDATGLQTGVEAAPLLKDLVEQYSLELNPLGRLHVENDFEIPGMRNGDGRVYAAGAMTLGGPHAAVDSFLGLQYGALRSADALAALGAPGPRHLGGFKSVVGWTKWSLGIEP